jgi:hypothetical protein
LVSSGSATEPTTVGGYFLGVPTDYGVWELEFEADAPAEFIDAFVYAQQLVEVDYLEDPALSYSYTIDTEGPSDLILTPKGFKLRFYYQPGGFAHYGEPGKGWDERWSYQSFIPYATADLTPVDGPVNWAFYVSAVPEPAGWAMMIVGFGFAGTALRRVRLVRAA